MALRISYMLTIYFYFKWQPGHCHSMGRTRRKLLCVSLDRISQDSVVILFVSMARSLFRYITSCMYQHNVYNLNTMCSHWFAADAVTGLLSFKKTSLACLYANIAISEKSDIRDRYDAQNTKANMPSYSSSTHHINEHFFQCEDRPHEIDWRGSENTKTEPIGKTLYALAKEPRETLLMNFSAPLQNMPKKRVLQYTYLSTDPMYRRHAGKTL